MVVFAALAIGSAQALAAPMGMMTGLETGTYYAIGQDIAAIAADTGAPVMVRPSKGSIDNLQKMTDSKENAALGIVQADVLAFLQRSDKPKSRDITKRLRMVMPLFREEIHILARRDITSIDDLNGKRVVVGSSGSGSMMTSLNLFSMLNITPSNMYQVEAPEAVVAVLAGRADAMIFVGGKPVPMFKNLEQLRTSGNMEMKDLLTQVHFLALPEDQTAKLYEPALITPEDYDFVTEMVPTLAVRSVLVTYDFTLKDTPYYKQRCRQLATLGKTLHDKLPWLKETGHAKWQEVELDRDLAFWKRDECAWPTAKTGTVREEKIMKLPAPSIQSGKPSPRQSELEQELLGIITGGR